MLSVKDNSAAFKKNLKKKSEKIKRAIQIALADASAFQVDAIRERTEQRGKDVKGRSFTPYSAGYKQALRKGKMILKTEINRQKNLLILILQVECLVH